MSDSISYPEVWLLELGVKDDALWQPFRLLPDSREERRTGFSEQWNCPPNGLKGSELAQVMWNLWCRHEVEFAVRINTNDEDLSQFTPTSAFEIHSLLIEEFQRLSREGAFRRYSRVTAEGIKRWEEYAKPDWTRYCGEFNGKLWERGETTWSQSAVLESFAREVLDVCSSDVFDPATIHWETAQVVHHEPWDLFPGKQLPHGVTVSVSVTEHGQCGFPCDEWERVRPMSEEYRRRLREISHWYENATHNHPDRPKPQPDDAGTKEGSL